jgi:hypothetical protein
MSHLGIDVFSPVLAEHQQLSWHKDVNEEHQRFSWHEDDVKDNIDIEEDISLGEQSEEEQEVDEVHELLNISMKLESIIERIVDERIAKQKIRDMNKKTEREEIEELARNMYHRYCKSTQWKSINYEDLPKEDEFFNDDKKEIQANAWRLTAQYVLYNIQGNDRCKDCFNRVCNCKMHVLNKIKKLEN